MKDQIKQKWSEMEPQSKRKAVMAMLVIIVIVVGGVGYKLSRSSAPVQEAKNDKKGIALDKNMLEKSLYRESQVEQGKTAEQIKELTKQIEDMKKEKEQKAEKEAANGKVNIPGSQGNAKMPPLPVLPAPSHAGSYSVPPPPGTPAGGSPMGPNDMVMVKVSETVMGGIEIVSASVAEAKKDKAEEDKKKEEVVYLPPSFMEATLLSGLDAPTAEGAKGHPVPVLLRVKEIAVLPNKVKADLKGCFVIAEGTGSLATERAELRIVSLSCLSKKGKSVIDQKVKGFVVDSDGKIGLRGRVVAKMGVHIARSLVAGIFGGLGDAIKQATLTTNFTALGTTQSTLTSNDLSKIAQAGIGGGISTAATEIQKFYLDLARQTLPVIEVGATKPVTLVISEGTELKIKEWRKQ